MRASAGPSRARRRTEFVLDLPQFFFDGCLTTDRIQLLLDPVGRQRRGRLPPARSLLADRFSPRLQAFGLLRGAAFGVSSLAYPAEQIRSLCRCSRLSDCICRLERLFLEGECPQARVKLAGCLCQPLLVGSQLRLLGGQVVGMSDGLGPKSQRVAAEFVLASRDGLRCLGAEPLGGAAELAFLPASAVPARHEVDGRSVHLAQDVLLPGIGVVERLPWIFGAIQQRVDLHFVQFGNPACNAHSNPSPLTSAMIAGAGPGRGGALVPAAGSESLSAPAVKASPETGMEHGKEAVMSHTGVSNLDNSIDKAAAWLTEVAAEFGTEDRRFAYRIIRAWMHVLRDRLPVPVAAHLAAQLPELLRGVFYDGWNPSRVPVKYDSAEYVRRFANEATIHDTEVPRAASLVARVARRHVSSGALDEALDALPADIRQLAA